jgi:hypothetical protein
MIFKEEELQRKKEQEDMREVDSVQETAAAAKQISLPIWILHLLMRIP